MASGCAAEAARARNTAVIDRPMRESTTSQLTLALPVPHKCSLDSVMLVKSSVFVA